MYRRKAAARQNLTALKTKKKQNMAKNDFQYGGWNSYTLQCGMWLWNRDNAFTKWQHPTMWYVALGWHAIEFAQTSAILEFYIWFRFRPHHRSRYVILHQSPQFYPNRTTLDRKIMTPCRFSRWRISAILDFRDPIMHALKTQLQLTKLLSFQKNRVFAFWRQDPRWRISAILDFRGPIMGSLKSPIGHQ